MENWNIAAPLDGPLEQHPVDECQSVESCISENNEWCFAIDQGEVKHYLLSP